MIGNNPIDSVQQGDPITSDWANSIVGRVNDLSNLGGDVRTSNVGGAFLSLLKESQLPFSVIQCNTPKIDTTAYEQWDYDTTPFDVCHLKEGDGSCDYVAEPPTEYGAQPLGVLLSPIVDLYVPVIDMGVVIVFHDSTLGDLDPGDWCSNVTPNDEKWDVAGAADWETSQVIEDTYGTIKIIGKLSNINDKLTGKIAQTAKAGTTYEPYLGWLERQRSTTNTVMAYNGHGTTAPKGGISDISDAGDTVSQVEFTQPGATNSVGNYAINLQDVPSGEIGRIALDGGPWGVDYTGGEEGEYLGPVGSQWSADSGNLLEIVRRSIDGTALCRFRSKNTGQKILVYNNSGSTLNQGNIVEVTGLKTEDPEVWNISLPSDDDIVNFIVIDEEIENEENGWARTSGYVPVVNYSGSITSGANIGAASGSTNASIVGSGLTVVEDNTSSAACIFDRIEDLIYEVTVLDRTNGNVTIEKLNSDRSLDGDSSLTIPYDRTVDIYVGARGQIRRYNDGPSVFQVITEQTAWEVTTVDTTNEVCNLQRPDGSGGTEASTVIQDVPYFTRKKELEVSVGDQGILTSYYGGSPVFFPYHPAPTNPSNSENSGGISTHLGAVNGEGSETALTDDFDFRTNSHDGNNDGLYLDMVTRVVYDESSDKTLYGYKRTLIFDQLGHLTEVTDETRFTIDAAEPCDGGV